MAHTPEGKSTYTQSLYLSGTGTVVWAVTSAVLVWLLSAPPGKLLHLFLPLGMAVYIVVFALGLQGTRQILISRDKGPWTSSLLAGAAWSGLVACLALYAMLYTFIAFMHGF